MTVDLSAELPTNKSVVAIGRGGDVDVVVGEVET